MYTWKFNTRFSHVAHELHKMRDELHNINFYSSNNIIDINNDIVPDGLKKWIDFYFPDEIFKKNYDFKIITIITPGKHNLIDLFNIPKQSNIFLLPVANNFVKLNVNDITLFLNRNDNYLNCFSPEKLNVILTSSLNNRIQPFIGIIFYKKTKNNLDTIILDKLIGENKFYDNTIIQKYLNLSKKIKATNFCWFHDRLAVYNKNKNKTLLYISTFGEHLNKLGYIKFIQTKFFNEYFNEYNIIILTKTPQDLYDSHYYGIGPLTNNIQNSIEYLKNFITEKVPSTKRLIVMSQCTDVYVGTLLAEGLNANIHIAKGFKNSIIDYDFPEIFYHNGLNADSTLEKIIHNNFTKHIYFYPKDVKQSTNMSPYRILHSIDNYLSHNTFNPFFNFYRDDKDLIKYNKALPLVSFLETNSSFFKTEIHREVLNNTKNINEYLV